MPHDKRGNVLKVGDLVLLACTIAAITSEGDTQCNVTAEAVERPEGEGYIPSLAANSRFYEKALNEDGSLRLPSQFQIGDRVEVAVVPDSSSYFGNVCGVHFSSGKVHYDVQSDAGHVLRDIDSVDVVASDSIASDLSTPDKTNPGGPTGPTGHIDNPDPVKEFNIFGGPACDAPTAEQLLGAPFPPSEDALASENEEPRTKNEELPLPRYKSHKEVRALQILTIGHEFVRPQLVPVDERFAPIELDPAWVEKHQPEAGGYYVIYDDGYTSYSPAAAFEAGYTRVEDTGSAEGPLPVPLGLAAEPAALPSRFLAGIVDECPMTGEKQSMAYAGGKEAGHENLTLITRGDSTAWKHQLITEEIGIDEIPPVSKA